MKIRKMECALLGMVCVLALSCGFASAQEKAAPATTQVHMVITSAAERSDSELPRLKPEDVKVKQGKTFLQVTQLIPSQGDNAALQLMILIDDTLNTSFGVSSIKIFSCSAALSPWEGLNGVT